MIPSAIPTIASKGLLNYSGEEQRNVTPLLNGYPVVGMLI